MANTRKRAWEREYEKWQRGEMDAEYDELKLRLENRSEETKSQEVENKKGEKIAVKLTAKRGGLNKEEYDNYQKMGKIKENISKVKNILELRENIKAEIKEIKEELKLRKKLSDLTLNMNKLEKEMEGLFALREEKENVIKDITKKLSNKDLSPEERENLEKVLVKENKEREKIVSKIDDNNKKFAQNNDELRGSNKTNDKFKNITNEELKSNITKKEVEISKCNIACSNLMKGESWENVELKINQVGEKYTDKNGEISRTKEVIKAEEELKNAKIKVEEELKNAQIKAEEAQKRNGNLPIAETYEEFKKKYMKEHRIGQLFAKITFGRVGNSEKKVREEYEKSTKQYEEFKEKYKKEHPNEALSEKKIYKEYVEKGKPEAEKAAAEAKIEAEEAGIAAVEAMEALKAAEEKVKEAKDLATKNNFKAYLRQVAEKGMDGAKADKMANAKERLAAMKQQAQDSNRYVIDENGVKHDTFGRDVGKDDNGFEPGDE